MEVAILMKRALSLLLTCIRPWMVAGLLVAVCLIPFLDAAQFSHQNLEYRIKGAFLYNFIKFVEWPEGTFKGEQSPFIIGILDQQTESVSVIREVLADKATPMGRAIEIRHFSGWNEALVECHLVFISRTAQIDWQAVVKRTTGKPLLLVGEQDGFAQQGGMMNLLATSDAVRCEVNLRRAQKAQLKLSGRLVNIARLVRDSESEL